MQFTTDKLIEAAKLLKLVTPVRPTHPALAYTEVGVDFGELHLVATSLSEWLVLACRVDDSVGGIGYLPVKEVASLKTKGVISVVRDDAVMTLVSSSIRLKYLHIEDVETAFPSLVNHAPASLTVDATALLTGLNTVGYAVSTDPRKQILQAVNFNLKSGTLNLAATDGHRLAVATLSVSGADTEFNLPASALKILSKLLHKGDRVSIGYSNGLITFYGTHKAFDYTYSVRAIEGQYLAYDRLIPSKFDFSVSLNRTRLIDALTKAKSWVSKTYNIINLESSDQGYVMTSVKDYISFSVSLSDKITEAPVISLNYYFLLDTVKVTKGDLITLHINTPLSPIMITDTDSNTRHLLMPVKSRK